MIRILCWYVALLLTLGRVQAQHIFQEDHLPTSVSIHEHAQVAYAEPGEIRVEEIIAGQHSLNFVPVLSANQNFGFTNGAYWVTFSLKNASSRELRYYLETGRPITDEVTFYLLSSQGGLTQSNSGDKLPFPQRAFPHRKVIFPVVLAPGESVQAYLYLQSDGEVINLPLVLRDSPALVANTYFEQWIFGVFYGILILAFITYAFFFFALKERSFLLYSLYVVFVGLLQFSLDGYFYQYVTPDGGWLSQRSVLLFAIVSTFFFGRYNQVFLGIRQFSKALHIGFTLGFGLLAVLLAMLLLAPAIPSITYPLANAAGMILLLLSLASIIVRYRKKAPIDGFFTTGILCLISGYVVFIMSNFGIVSDSFLATNSAKLGTGLEVIFLSLSMANRIRLLKSEKEQMQALALKRSEEMNEVKSYFLSNMSHELRTPLNAIMALTDIMMQEGTDPKVKGHCEVIRLSSMSLLTSVNDILDFSKIEKGELFLNRLDFAPMCALELTWKGAAHHAQQKNLQFDLSVDPSLPPLLTGDPIRLGQIVQNLLNNSVKFTEKGKIQLSLSAIPVTEHQIRLVIRVEDTGIGIPSEKIDTLFDSFVQENITHKRKFGGLGLGLSIVKHLVDLHRGTIRLSSTLGEGTACMVELPYDVADLPQQPEMPYFPIDTFDLKGTHLLLVEDNPVNQLVMKAILKKWENTTFAVAANGLEALDLLRKEPFDLILMDLQMPEMDGYEATMAIRAGEAGAEAQHIPIIAVTADVAESTRERVMEIGMDTLLTKPVDKGLLYQTVVKVLSGRMMAAQVV